MGQCPNSFIWILISWDYNTYLFVDSPNPAKRRRLAADAAEQRAGRFMSCESPPHPDHAGFRHFYEDSAYGGAYSANYEDDSTGAGPSRRSDYSTGSETDYYGLYLECPQAFDDCISPPPATNHIAVDVKTEESDDDDVIYVETVPARSISGPLIELN